MNVDVRPAEAGFLLDHEQTRLTELEGVITHSFEQAGAAFAEIRDLRLYRATHSRFEDYCQERWGVTSRHVNHQIAAASVNAHLGTTVPKPTAESQARALVPLLDRPDVLQEAWGEVVELHDEPTAADVRAVVQRKMDVHYSSKTDDWATPQDFFDKVAWEFPFNLDVCALPESAKCEAFFSPEDDGLAQEWIGTCWMNPPYGDEIRHWVKKAHDSAVTGKATVVCLLPARVDTGWWWDYCRFAEVRFLRGRLKFGGGENSAPFPSALVIFSSSAPAKTVYWER